MSNIARSWSLGEVIITYKKLALIICSKQNKQFSNEIVLKVLKIILVKIFDCLLILLIW